MLDDITFAAAAWNEEQRAPRLLRLAKRHFSHSVLAVQASSDRTLEIARSILDRPTDVILEHPHMGAGDFSLHQIVRHIKTPWTLVISLDEMPSPALLSSLPDAIKAAVEQKADGVWLPFRSKIEDIEYDEQHGHVRLYRSHLRWPNKLHSGPPTRRDLVWQHGYVRHDRSLDEMVTDYLRYLKIGRGDRGWDRHNLMMMREACRSIAAKHGWQYVTAYGWWPEVRREAFEDEDPWQSTGTRGEPTMTP